MCQWVPGRHEYNKTDCGRCDCPDSSAPHKPDTTKGVIRHCTVRGLPC